MSQPLQSDAAFIERLYEIFGQDDGAEDFTHRAVYTYLLGVYVAVNALRDAYLLVEGPDCAYMKSQYIQGNHDWLSTLTTVSGVHRLANTALHPAMMTDTREPALREQMTRIAAHPEAGALLITSMPMAFITGADYERLCRAVGDETGKAVLHVPGLSLSGDWIDGYAETLKAFARQLDLPAVPRRPRTVAIVGYLFDRNEEDHGANLRELRRMIEALDLEIVSVWLSGGTVADLRAAAEADTILSLPYGRRAARLLARRTGARVIELPLPFGLDACEHWLSTLGDAFDRSAAAAAFVAREMQRIAPKIEWLIPFIFQDLQAGYIGDPYLLPGLQDTLRLLGADLAFAVVTNRSAHLGEFGERRERLDLLAYPTHKAFLRFVVTRLRKHRVGLLVTNNAGTSVPLPNAAMVEFGFPAVFQHALFDRPFLGHAGFLAFVDTLANALRLAELRRNQVGYSQGGVTLR